MPVTGNKIVLAVAAALALGAGVYAVSWRGGAVTGADHRDKALVQAGERIYAEHCAQCHGKDLEGQPHWRTRNADGTLPAPPHDAGGHTWHHPDQVLFDYTKRGGQALAPPGFKSAMPGFTESLSDGDIWAVLAFIKSRWPARELEQQRRIDARSRD